jgi:hypothetical protein
MYCSSIVMNPSLSKKKLRTVSVVVVVFRFRFTFHVTAAGRPTRHLADVIIRKLTRGFTPDGYRGQRREGKKLSLHRFLSGVVTFNPYASCLLSSDRRCSTKTGIVSVHIDRACMYLHVLM